MLNQGGNDCFLDTALLQNGNAEPLSHTAVLTALQDLDHTSDDGVELLDADPWYDD